MHLTCLRQENRRREIQSEILIYNIAGADTAGSSRMLLYKD
jgi:hypothetical protein